MHSVVLDTNVLVAALRSKTGASHCLLLQLAHTPKWQPSISTALALQYESVLRRHIAELGLTQHEADVLINFVCTAAREVQIRFRWRPLSPDADDDLVLEVAIAAGARYIITFNKRDFVEATKFGIEVMTPREFLNVVN
jgi:predicted nucleic acid-binding protein